MGRVVSALLGRICGIEEMHSMAGPLPLLSPPSHAPLSPQVLTQFDTYTQLISAPPPPMPRSPHRCSLSLTPTPSSSTARTRRCSWPQPSWSISRRWGRRCVWGRLGHVGEGGGRWGGWV